MSLQRWRPQKTGGGLRGRGRAATSCCTALRARDLQDDRPDMDGNAIGNPLGPPMRSAINSTMTKIGQEDEREGLEFFT